VSYKSASVQANAGDERKSVAYASEEAEHYSHREDIVEVGYHVVGVVENHVQGGVS